MVLLTIADSFPWRGAILQYTASFSLASSKAKKRSETLCRAFLPFL
jgi:hypothetical protein